MIGAEGGRKPPEKGENDMEEKIIAEAVAPEQQEPVPEAITGSVPEAVSETAPEVIPEVAEEPAPEECGCESESVAEEPAPEECGCESEPVAEEPATQSVSKGKKLLKKWWFWAIIAVVVAGLVLGISLIAGDKGSDPGSPSGGTSSVTSYVDPFVTLVKTAENSKYGITYGRAFDSFFTHPRWEYFQAVSGEHVVEFNGGFLYDGEPATATVQFVIDLDEGMLEVYHLSIDGVAQSRLMLSALLEKVFTSY